jgi:purine-nucleoside phosphorylase
MQNQQLVEAATEYLRARISLTPPIRAGVVLGTGLGNWTHSLQNACTIPYAEIPGFPKSTVPGHAGALICGTVEGRSVLALSGRFHLYEGYSPAEVCFGVRVLARLGVDALVLTNAAGAINPQCDAGSLMCITDHINATGVSPLTGPNADAWGPRFPDMSSVWDPGLRALAMEQALRLGIRLERGVYIQVPGPQLETPAETRAYRILGADAVGMSTVLEAIAARHMGLRLLGISCLTNKNLPDCMAETSLEEILAMAALSGEAMSRLLSAVIVSL